MTKEELREKANDLPLAPGVYLMMDKTGRVIYVGKAKKLKNRVSQYFQDSASHTAKTRNMVSQVDRFDTIFVTSEFEALVLENSLIKRHMPRYNILLKDDKGYPFVRLSKEAYPRFSLVNKMANDSARYFGPFGGRFETRQALDAVCVALRLPTCSRKFPRDIGAERPCLNFHMGRCDGFCRPEMTAEAYNRRIEQAVQLVLGGAKLIGTNPDLTGPIENGIVPACRALVAPIEMATGTQAYFCGKPNPLMMRTGLKMLHCHSAEAVMVGDRMDTDVISGMESGMSTVLVLSGVSTRETIKTYAYRPSMVLNGVGDIVSFARGEKTED